MSTLTPLTLQLPDGRYLGYALAGDPRGTPVVTFHGLPGSCMECLLIHEAAKKLNIRIVTASRPGYGQSTANSRQTLIERGNDIVHLADHLGISSFAIIGISGGAPSALACAFLLQQRVTQVAIVCGLGPLYHTDLIEDMRWPTAFSFRVARLSRLLLQFCVGVPVLAVAKSSPLFMLSLVGLINGGSDKTLLKDPTVRTMLAANIREAFRQGTAGAAQDMHLYTQPWNFELPDIKLPVTLWHGDADNIVPMSHARYLQQLLPNSQLTVVPNMGHFSLPILHAEQILQHFINTRRPSD